ncbi:MAG TPA: response regulator transcription factor [Helicobacteraceae bacterium]|nr:response regulator transcription factor [Helicobacteraceae bacterium]
MAKIIIIEDEPIVAKDIKATLKKLGHNVVGWGINEESTYALINEHHPDIVFMDINLEEEVDGIDIAEALRYENKEIKIIYLTAYADEKTIDRAVKTNPSGYIVKPFNRRDIDITMKLVMQESKDVAIENDALKPIGLDYYYNYGTKNLFYKEIPIALTSSELKLFDICLQHRGHIVPHEQLDALIWPDKSVTESTRRGLHFRLRTKLNNNLFETVVGLGCRIRAI